MFTNSSFRLLLVAVVTLLITACAQPKIVIKETVSSGSVAETSLVISDVRPADDKEASIGSMLITSDRYGIWTLGDEGFDPAVLTLLRRYIMKEIAGWSDKPRTIHMTLKNLKFEANHQADLLASSSTQLGPLGVAIAEAMHGKKFEMQIDKTRPFVIGFISADVKVTYANGKSVTKSLQTYKAENFSSHVDVEGRQNAARSVLKTLFTDFASSLK
ncbi:MAG: hypothetical protein P8Y24_01610 [Gammaproteobacteria bacterium]